MFIELRELYYRNGTYLTKPLLLNANEISSILEYDNSGYREFRTIVMNNGKIYEVADKYKDIVCKICGGSS